MRFENTNELARAEFVNVDLSGASFRNVNLRGATITEALLADVRLSGEIRGLVVNDVEVAPLISAELDRRHPERTMLRPDDAAGTRQAWLVIERLWAATKERAGALPEETLRLRVGGEWSFLETVRHLVFVTDLWIGGNVLGRTDHFHPAGVPPSFVTDHERFGIDASLDPSFADAVRAREERMATVCALIADVTDDQLHEPRGDQTVLSCLRTLFDEEWHHNWYANRDLDVVDTRT
jgi:hypothetical protein